MRTRKSNRTFIQEIIRRSWFIGTIMLAVLAVVSPPRALSLNDAVTGSRYLGGMAVVVQGDDGSNGREAVTFRNFTPAVTLAAGIYSDESSPASRPESVNPEAAAGIMNFILFSMKPKISSTADASPWEKFQDVGLIGSFNFAAGHSFDLGGMVASTFDAKSESGSRGRTPDAIGIALHDSFNIFDASGKKADLLSSAAIFSYDPLTNLATLFRNYSRLEKSDTRGGGGGGEGLAGEEERRGSRGHRLHRGPDRTWRQVRQPRNRRHHVRRGGHPQPRARDLRPPGRRSRTGGIRRLAAQTEKSPSRVSGTAGLTGEGGGAAGSGWTDSRDVFPSPQNVVAGLNSPGPFSSMAPPLCDPTRVYFLSTPV